MREVGQALAQELSLPGFAERYSENYVEGYYLVTRCLGIFIRLSHTDHIDLADYPFWMTFHPDGYWEDDFERSCERLADLVARRLTVTGYRVARVPDDGRIGAAIWRYSIRPGCSGRERGDISIAIDKTHVGPAGGA
ncbi:hypothetical protein [Ancylobacter terrae]|uniref:hypothetical protein n=1 Tax=Ancylobacter sp. sgz301288 TaxID=3342077 RepID=UPI00385856E0